MNKKKLKWAAMLAVLTLAVAGCSTSGTGEEPNEAPNQGEVQEPATADPTPSEEPGEEPAEEPAEEPSAETPSQELGVETGATVEIETTIEGMAENVEVTEYTIAPYGIQYQLRTLMGEPAVENGQVVYKTQMGDDVATVAIEVQEGVSLNDAAAAAQAMFADGYEAGDEPRTIGTDLNGFAGIAQGYTKDGYYHGYHVFEVDGKAVVIYRSYPFDAGDGMGAVMHEMTKSLKAE